MGQHENRTSIKVLYALNREAICVAASAAQRSDFNLLQRLGIDEDCIPLLKSIGIHELDRLRDFQASVVDIHFNSQTLTQLLSHLQRETQQEALVDRAIRLGLRQPMLRALAGISRREFEQRRAMLKMPAGEPGRIESLNERDELRVLYLWMTLKKDEPQLTDLERLCRVADETALSADRIWNAVMEGI